MNFNLSFLNKIEKLKDKKIDILATAITAGFTASDLAMLELSYMPKYNTATDIINVIGSKGENK